MSKNKVIPIVPKAFKVEPIVRSEDQSELVDEPIHIINEIIMNTNAFLATKQTDLTAMLYLGSAQRYAMRFINQPNLVDPMAGTFAGIPILWVDAPYHVNLVARRNDPKPA